MQYSTFERIILTTIPYRAVIRKLVFFFWTSSKKQGLDQKKKKPSNNMYDRYNTLLNLEREVERLERAVLCMTFVVFLWKTD